MEKRLYRNERDKIVAGVSSGLAEYFDMDVTWVRIIFVFAAVFGFSGVIIYLILWIVVPPKPFTGNGFSPYTADYRVYEEKTSAYSSSGTNQSETPLPPLKRKDSSNTRLIGGLLLVFFGAYFLLEEFDIFPYWLQLHKMWPLIFIVLGFLIIFKTEKKATPPPPAERDNRETGVSEEPPVSGTDESLNDDYEKR